MHPNRDRQQFDREYLEFVRDILSLITLPPVHGTSYHTEFSAFLPFDYSKIRYPPHAQNSRSPRTTILRSS